MEIKLAFALVAIASFVTCANSAGGLNAIGDDELLEQIKSNDFLIVLFCEYRQRANQYSHLLRVRPDE